MALGAGFRSFIVETDSQTSINLIHDCQASHPCFSLVLSIKKFAAKVVFFFFFPLQAHIGLSLNYQFRINDIVPSFISNVLADVSSIVFQ